MANRQFGGKLTADLVSQYEKSPNWKDGTFQNILPTSLAFNPLQMPKMIYKQLSGKKSREPKSPIKIHPFDKSEFLKPGNEARFIWYGHSVLFLRMNEKNILIDPMLGPDCSPFGPVRTRRYSENTLGFIDEFPEIDLILLTHDHYDHLDLASMEKLKSKTKKFFVALGVKRHLVSWGIDPEVITEFDWFDVKDFEGIKITFTPTRHFAGRGLKDRMKSLWGGWVLKSEIENIWFSGDSGYGNHFKTIGEKLGPFDLAFMECGQYNDYWHDIHMFPDESVQAALDAKVKKAIPVHWAGFSLSFQHTWSEPASEFVKFAEEKKLAYSLPEPGKIYFVKDEIKEKWF
ncbi:MAG: hypothetical protein GC181_10600 [Bacteroidetes bacterium]|nr:hypothetical protein [Bacteroidota bacterium]